MAIYNTSWMDNLTSPTDMIVGIGTNAGDPYLIGHLFLLAFFIIFLVLAMRNDFKETLLVDSFITTIIAILFAFGNVIPFTSIIYPMIIVIFTAAINFYSD